MPPFLDTRTARKFECPTTVLSKSDPPAKWKDAKRTLASEGCASPIMGDGNVMEILSEGGSLPECFKAARKGPLGHVRWTGVKRRSTSETGATVITSGGGATEILWEAGLLKPLLVSNRSCIVVSHSAQEQKGFSLTLIISVGAMSIGSGLRSGITEMSK